LVAKRKGENFRRIKATTLVKYLEEAESSNSESIFGLVSQNSENEDCNKENFDTKSVA